MIAAALLVPSSHSGLANDDLGTLSDLLPPSQSTPTPRSQNGRVRIFNNFLVHPMPVWSRYANGPAPAEQSRMQASTQNNTYQMRMVPREEEFDNWKSLFTVVGHDRPVRSLEQHARVVGRQFISICSPGNTQLFLVDNNPSRIMQVVACGNYSRDKSIGQIAVVVAIQNKNGLVTMTRQWRTKSFQSRIRSSWPVPKREVDGVLIELSRARLIPT